MKSVKLFLAASLLCVSQFSMAFGTQAEINAYNTAITNITSVGINATQSQIDAIVNAAADAGIAAADVVTALYNAGVSPTLISNAMNSNIASGTGTAGTQPNCSPNCSGVTGRVAYPASAAGTTTTTLSSLGFSPTGAGGSQGTVYQGGGQQLGFTPSTCSGVSKC